MLEALHPPRYESSRLTACEAFSLGLSVGASLSTMKTMWIEQPVEACVEFPRGLAFPHLRSIRFRDEDIRFTGRVHVDQTPTALLYRVHDGRNDYTVRFEIAHQRWVLEAIRGISPSSAPCERGDRHSALRGSRTKGGVEGSETDRLMRSAHAAGVGMDEPATMG